MPEGRLCSEAGSLLFLAFTILMLCSLPSLTQSETVALTYAPQTTTASATVTSNTTSTSETSSQTTSASVASSSTQWDLMIPLVLMAIGATLTVVVAAIVVAKRRHARVVPNVQLVCPRCRAPVSPYDAACRNCRTPIYHPYRYYQRRR
jgi:hypothetical protein